MIHRDPPRLAPLLALALTVSLTPGCGPKTGSDGSGDGSSGHVDTNTHGSADETGPGNTGRGPFRDEWRVEVDMDFIHTAPDGLIQIFDLTIGGRETMDNFANRGDLIVDFDGPADRILVELRRFTFAANQAQAEADFDDLFLWAYSVPQVGRPQDLDPADDCVASGWHSGCQVRVYYDGQNQLRRSGADIRVTLPSDYRQHITLITEDNDEEPDYLDRGNVCVSNLFANADIDTENANVWVSLSPDANPAPLCSAAQIETCETWTDGTGAPAPWAPECDCLATGAGFGALSIDSRSNTAANITVDMPADLWATITAESDGDHCEAQITVPGAVPSETGNDFPWQASATTNYPGQPAILGAGFIIQTTSDACGPVAFTEHPDDYVGSGNGSMQMSTERGNLEVCSDCIVQSCDQLVP